MNYFPEMVMRREMSYAEIEEAQRQLEFRTKVWKTKTPKLRRWREAYRRTLADYERDRYERRDPKSFLEGWDQAKVCFAVVDGELKARGLDGPFR